MGLNSWTPVNMHSTNGFEVSTRVIPTSLTRTRYVTSSNPRMCRQTTLVTQTAKVIADCNGMDGKRTVVGSRFRMRKLNEKLYAGIEHFIYSMD